MNKTDSDIIQTILMAFHAKEKLERVEKYLRSSPNMVPKKDLEEILNEGGYDEKEEGLF